MDNNRLIIKSSKISRLIYIAILVAMGSVLHGLEGLIPLPNLFIPGAKLGFANIVTLIAMVLLGQNEALLVTLLRVFLGGLISETFSILGFSFKWWNICLVRNEVNEQSHRISSHHQYVRSPFP